jgi:eukaryotic-like serine/threonine-protein kinase
MSITSPDVQIGQRYVLAEEIGEGRGSVVWRGEDIVLKRPVAVRLVAPEYIPAYRAALGVTARIAHPAYVGIYDALPHEDHFAIVQEYILGETFAALAARQSDAVSVARMGRQIVLALAHAHRQGIAHGDLTPASLFRDQWGAMRLNNVQLPPDLAYFAAAATLLVPDTPWDAAEPSPAGDLRAVGVLLWLLLAGLGEVPLDLAGSPADWDRIPAAVPEELRAIIERLIGMEPTSPFETAEEALTELGGFIRVFEDQKPRRAMPPWLAPVPRAEGTGTAPATIVVPPATERALGRHAAPEPDTVQTQSPITRPVPIAPGVVETSDASATLPDRAHVAAPHPAPPPVPASSPMLDYMLLAGLAVALFVFWLVIGYLLPVLFGH